MNKFLHPKTRHVAVLSVHTCPLAMLGGKKTGGMNVYVRDFCRELGRRGIQVDVFTRSQDSCVPMVVHDLGPNARVIHIAAGPERPLPVPEIEQHLDQFVQGVWEFSLVEGVQYDVIHSHYWLSGIVAGMLNDKLNSDVPIVQMFHTLGHMKNRISPSAKYRAPQSRIDGEMRVIHDIADTIIAATPAEEQQLIDLYNCDPTKITIVPPGVDTNRFSPIPKNEAKAHIGFERFDKIVLLAARIEPLKGIDTLLEAVAILDCEHHESLENTGVIIVGGDPWADDLDTEMARLKTMREELGISNFVTFVGSKDQMLLPNFYAAAEIVVMPSHYESFGLVALEAMAMGTPVIASEVGGLAHLVKDGITGYHMPSRCPEALAGKMLALLQDDAGRTQMGECAHHYASGYAWQCIVNNIIDVYDVHLENKVESTISFDFTPPKTMPCAVA